MQVQPPPRPPPHLDHVGHLLVVLGHHPVEAARARRRRALRPTGLRSAADDARHVVVHLLGAGDEAARLAALDAVVALFRKAREGDAPAARGRRLGGALAEQRCRELLELGLDDRVADEGYPERAAARRGRRGRGRGGRRGGGEGGEERGEGAGGLGAAGGEVGPARRRRTPRPREQLVAAADGRARLSRETGGEEGWAVRGRAGLATRGRDNARGCQRPSRRRLLRRPSPAGPFLRLLFRAAQTLFRAIPAMTHSSVATRKQQAPLEPPPRCYPTTEKLPATRQQRPLLRWRSAGVQRHPIEPPPVYVLCCTLVGCAHARAGTTPRTGALGEPAI